MHQSTGGRAKQKWLRETHSVTYAPGLSTLYYLSRIVAQPPPSFLCCSRPPSHHPSSLTPVYLVPALHLLPLSTTFWSSGAHPFFPHAQTISLLNDPLYSLTPFLYQLSYAPLHSYNFIHLRHSNRTSQALHLKNFHLPSLSTSHTYEKPLLVGRSLCSVRRRWYVELPIFFTSNGVT